MARDRARHERNLALQERRLGALVDLLEVLDKAAEIHHGVTKALDAAREGGGVTPSLEPALAALVDHTRAIIATRRRAAMLLPEAARPDLQLLVDETTRFATAVGSIDNLNLVQSAAAGVDHGVMHRAVVEAVERRASNFFDGQQPWPSTTIAEELGVDEPAT